MEGVRTAYLLSIAMLSIPIRAGADVAPPREEREKRPVEVVRPNPVTCDPTPWQREGRLRPLLRQQKVVRSPDLIVGFDLKSVSPSVQREGQGGILSNNSFHRLAGCSDDPDGKGIAQGTRVLDPVSGLEIVVSSVQSAGRSGRGWPGVRCGLRISDPAQPSRYLDVPGSEVPAFNQPTGILRDGDSVYLLLQFNGYASEIKGHGNLILAGDLCSHRIVWRSPNLVSNAPVLQLGEFLITGYGFTKEKDWLFVLDRRTGQSIQKLPLPKAPEAFRMSDGKLYVRLYDGYAVFAIK
jgi:hypothetical protein